MPPSERVAYLKEFEDSDKNDTPKKGGLIEKLIARGNRKTEEQIEREMRERETARLGTAPQGTAPQGTVRQGTVQ